MYHLFSAVEYAFEFINLEREISQRQKIKCSDSVNYNYIKLLKSNTQEFSLI